MKNKKIKKIAAKMCEHTSAGDRAHVGSAYEVCWAKVEARNHPQAHRPSVPAVQHPIGGLVRRGFFFFIFFKN